uniref:Peptidase S1 domain-containing protein n=1 Tax=Anopheles epiroticus TaxID=199890 RepID=A0A182P6H9_9DIPT
MCASKLTTERGVTDSAHKVRLGEWDTESEIDCEDLDDELSCAAPVQDFDYERVIVHEGYTGNHADRQNDIALIELKGQVEYNEFVKPICLPEPGTPNKEKLYYGTMWAAGWGRTETEFLCEKSQRERFGGRRKRKRKDVAYRSALDTEECEVALRASNPATHLMLTYTSTCASSPEGTLCTCYPGESLQGHRGHCRPDRPKWTDIT